MAQSCRFVDQDVAKYSALTRYPLQGNDVTAGRRVLKHTMCCIDKLAFCPLIPGTRKALKCGSRISKDTLILCGWQEMYLMGSGTAESFAVVQDAALLRRQLIT